MGGEEVAVHARAALDHEAHDAAGGEVVEHLVGRAAQDDGVGEVAALGEHAGARVDGARREHDPQRRRPQPAREPVGPALRGAHEQARVVGAHGVAADEDRVDARTLGVDAVEVGGPGEHEPLGGVVVEEAVDRHRGGGEHVREPHRRVAVIEHVAILAWSASEDAGLAPAGAHGSVRISLPVSVTRIVCSNCAVRDLSLVVTVQPSSQTS